MRVVTKKAVLAFLNRREMSYGNMRVYNQDGETRMLLHRNCIASKDAAGVVSIRNAGWNSRTTNDRLNGLLHYLPGQGRIHCKDFSPYLNGAPWSGEWTVVHIPDTIDTIASRYRARSAALDALTVEADAVDKARDLLKSSACEKCGFIVHALGCSGQIN